MMRESPRIRRLRTDHKAMVELRNASTILDFTGQGNPVDRYLIRFHGKGFWRPAGTNDVIIRERHEVGVELGASYPRMMPELAWKTPIFHPNVSASGVVCLGGYGTHWVPSLNLDELCEMLWDMIRYRNFDVESPYNRDAAHWAKEQRDYLLPIDHRPIRDRVATGGPVTSPTKPPITDTPKKSATDQVIVIEDDEEIVDAQIVESEDQDILFLD